MAATQRRIKMKEQNLELKPNGNVGPHLHFPHLFFNLKN